LEETCIEKLDREGWLGLVGDWDVVWGSCAAGPCHWQAKVSYNASTCELSGAMQEELPVLHGVRGKMSNFTTIKVPTTSLLAMGLTDSSLVKGFQVNFVLPPGWWSNGTVLEARGWFDSGANSVTIPAQGMFWARRHNASSTEENFISQGSLQISRSLAQSIQQDSTRSPIPVASNPCAKRWSEQGFQHPSGPSWWAFEWDYTSSMQDRFAGSLRYWSEQFTCEISMQLTQFNWSVPSNTSMLFRNFRSKQIPSDTFTAVGLLTPDPLQSFEAEVLTRAGGVLIQAGSVTGFKCPGGLDAGYLYFVYHGATRTREIVYLTDAN
jgi:hypothetical protein